MPSTIFKERKKQNDAFKRLCDARKYIVRFQWKPFFKFLLYHTLFYILLGPIVSVCIVLIDGYNVAINTQLIGLSLSFFNQLLQWACSVSSLILFFALPEHELSSAQVASLLIANLIRALIASIRYGYTSIDVLEQLHRDNLSHSTVLRDEYLISGWVAASPLQLIPLIEAAMWRNAINQEEFAIVFENKIPQELYRRLTNGEFYLESNNQIDENPGLWQSLTLNHILQRKKESCDAKLNRTDKKEEAVLVNHANNTPLNLNAGTDPAKNERQSIRSSQSEHTHAEYKGSLVTRELILKSQIDCRLPDWIRYLALCHCLIPFLTRLAENQTLYGDNWAQTYLLVVQVILGYQLYAMNIVMVSCGICMAQRRTLLMDYLGQVIQHNTTNLEGFCLRINTLSPSNIINWSRLRVLLLDCGLQFYARVALYNSAFLMIYGIYFLVLAAYYFGLLNISLSLEWQVMSWFDLGLFLSITLAIIYYGTLLNDQTLLHKDLLVRQSNLVLQTKLLVLGHRNTKCRDVDRTFRRLMGLRADKENALLTLEAVQDCLEAATSQLEVDHESVILLSLSPPYFALVSTSLGSVHLINSIC